MVKHIAKLKQPTSTNPPSTKVSQFLKKKSSELSSPKNEVTNKDATGDTKKVKTGIKKNKVVKKSIHERSLSKPTTQPPSAFNSNRFGNYISNLKKISVDANSQKQADEEINKTYMNGNPKNINSNYISRGKNQNKSYDSRKDENGMKSGSNNKFNKNEYQSSSKSPNYSKIELNPDKTRIIKQIGIPIKIDNFIEENSNDNLDNLIKKRNRKYTNTSVNLNIASSVTSKKNQIIKKKKNIFDIVNVNVNHSKQSSKIFNKNINKSFYLERKKGLKDEYKMCQSTLGSQKRSKSGQRDTMGFQSNIHYKKLNSNFYLNKNKSTINSSKKCKIFSKPNSPLNYKRVNINSIPFQIKDIHKQSSKVSNPEYSKNDYNKHVKGIRSMGKNSPKSSDVSKSVLNEVTGFLKTMIHPSTKNSSNNIKGKNLASFDKTNSIMKENTNFTWKLSKSIEENPLSLLVNKMSKKHLLRRSELIQTLKSSTFY